MQNTVVQNYTFKKETCVHFIELENKMKCSFEFKNGIPDSFLKPKEKINIWF